MKGTDYCERVAEIEPETATETSRVRDTVRDSDSKDERHRVTERQSKSERHRGRVRVFCKVGDAEQSSWVRG